MSFAVTAACIGCEASQLQAICGLQKGSVMTVNPYQPPTGEVSMAEQSFEDGQRRRPVGIAILAILYGIGAIVLAVLLAFLLSPGAANDEWFAEKGLPRMWFAGLFAAFIALGLATSIGLWLGAKWAWWMASWYHFFCSIGDGVQLALICATLRMRGSEEAIVLVTSRAIRLALQVAIVAYLIRPK